MSASAKHIRNWTDWTILIALSITWGSSFILIKKALIAFDDIQVASLRIAISTIISIPVVIYYFKEIDWSKWHLFLMVGLVGNGLPPYLFAVAQTEVSSSLAGVLNTLTPIFTLVLSFMFFKQRLNAKNALGVVIGLIGTILIAYSGNLNFEGGAFYISLIIIATILYALNINAVSYFFKTTRPIIIIAVSFVLFGPLSLIFLVDDSFTSAIQSHPYALRSSLAIVVLAVFGTFIATLFFFRLLQRTNTVFSSSTSYIIPLVALFWGLLDGEPFNTIYIVSLILILGGVYLTRKSR